MGMDRQDAEGEAVQGRPWTGTLDHAWSKPRRFSVSCRRISAMSSSSRSPPACGSPTSWVWNGRTSTWRLAMPGWARINRRIASRLPCRSTRPRWRSCDGSSASTACECSPTAGKPLATCQYAGLEKGVEACRHREFPLARFEAHLGLVASPVGNADARAAAARRLAVFGDGRTLCASGA